jgi:hypothetical protein
MIQIKIPKNLVGIADVNTKPVFVKSIKQLKSKLVQLEIITENEKYKLQLLDYFNLQVGNFKINILRI